MSEARFPRRVNVGCGATPTPGWINLDNSPTVRLAQFPILGPVIGALPARGMRLSFLREARAHGVQWATARRLPFRSESMDVVYSSHMLEHLTRADAENFLREAHRVLRPGGLLRIAVPDLSRLVDRYLETRDADAFVAGTLMPLPANPSFLGRLNLALFGHRGHAWMYDARSLTAGIARARFVEVTAIEAGQTRIEDPEPLNLFEREEESVYIEGIRA